MNLKRKSLLTLLITSVLMLGLFSFTSCEQNVDNPTSNNSEKPVSPAAPGNFKARGGNQFVKLSWETPKAKSFESLKILYGTAEDNLSETITPEKTGTSYKITNLTNDTPYFFQMEAYFGQDDNGNDIVKATSVLSATPKEGLSSVEMAEAMTIGWNLGNTFDADDETSWGAPKTTKAMIEAVKAAGFETIRIPVSWSKHVDSSYNINPTWMNRVKEVVDYAVENDMYIILNVHHDNYSESDITSKAGFCITTDSSKKTKSKDYLNKVWTQIATTFKDYDEKLVFEVLNEPRAVGEKWEWGFYSDEAKAKAKALCDVITEYEETCISAIRAVAGNEDRFLMVPGYAASGADSTMLAKYTMPDNDTAADKLLLSTHAYSPFDFAMGNSDSIFDSTDQSSLDSIFNYLKTTYTDKGIGVVMGEASASNKDNTDERIKWAKYYFGKAKDAGIPVVLWDNMVFSEDGHETPDQNGNTFNGEHHGWLCRTKGTWYFPTIIKAMMYTVGVTGYSLPEYVQLTTDNIGWNENAATTVDTKTYTFDNKEWQVSASYAASNFSGAKKGSILKLILSPIDSADYKKLCMYPKDSWEAIQLSGDIIGGTALEGAFSIENANTEVYYILPESEANVLKTSGITFRGYGVKLSAVYFYAK